uniref:four helix bundle protein n=1 Tax=Roseivirga sp. TaxID=1964215 RepID=UPI004048D83A
MKDFKKLKVWQKGFDIVIQTYSLAKHLPDSERYGLSSQMTRAAVSIPSNIAEGSSRSSQKDYQRFLEISLGSAFELETQVMITQALELSEDLLANNLLLEIREEQKMISKFISVLKEA